MLCIILDKEYHGKFICHAISWQKKKKKKFLKKLVLQRDQQYFDYLVVGFMFKFGTSDFCFPSNCFFGRRQLSQDGG